MLLASGDGCLEPGLTQGVIELFGNVFQELPLVALGLAYGLVEHAVAERVCMTEAEILELRLERVHAEAVGNRRVDFQGFAGDADLLVRRHRIERLHVVQAVGELEQDHPDVLHHREHHLAEALDLQLAAAVEVQLLQLADTVHQRGDLRAELLGDFILGCGRVLDDIVQKGGRDARVVQVQIGEDGGNRHRVRDIGITGVPLLPFVPAGAEGVCLADQLELLARQVGGFGQQAGQPIGAPRQRQMIEKGGGVVHGRDSSAVPASRCGLGSNSR